MILCFCKISVNKYFCLSWFIIRLRCSLLSSFELNITDAFQNGSFYLDSEPNRVCGKLPLRTSRSGLYPVPVGWCESPHCSVWGPSWAAEPAAQPAGWRRAAVAIAMKSWFSQTSMRPAIFSHLLPQPQLSINGFISNQDRLPVAGVQGAGGGAGLLGFHSQEGGQVQVQTCCSSSGPRSVLSTLRTGDPNLGRRNKLTYIPFWLSEVKPDHTDDVINHLIIYDCIQSLQTRLAEGVSTMQAPWQPCHQVVATKAHNAHQVLPPQRCQCLSGNRGKRREGLTADVPLLLFILLFLFFSAIWHVFLLDMTGSSFVNVNCDFHHFQHWWSWDTDAAAWS